MMQMRIRQAGRNLPYAPATKSAQQVKQVSYTSDHDQDETYASLPNIFHPQARQSQFKIRTRNNRIP